MQVTRIQSPVRAFAGRRQKGVDGMIAAAGLSQSKRRFSLAIGLAFAFEGFRAAFNWTSQSLVA